MVVAWQAPTTLRALHVLWEATGIPQVWIAKGNFFRFLNGSWRAGSSACSSCLSGTYSNITGV